MLFSLLTKSTKTGAASSSTTLVSSYRMVCQNSENNLNNTHHGKKPNIHCAKHSLWRNGSRVALNLDLGTRPSEQSGIYPSCFITAERIPYPPIPLNRMLGGPHSQPACDKNQTTNSWLPSQYPIHYTDYTITNPTQEP